MSKRTLIIGTIWTLLALQWVACSDNIGQDLLDARQLLTTGGASW